MSKGVYLETLPSAFTTTHQLLHSRQLGFSGSRNPATNDSGVQTRSFRVLLVQERKRGTDFNGSRRNTKPYLSGIVCGTGSVVAGLLPPSPETRPQLSSPLQARSRLVLGFLVGVANGERKMMATGIVPSDHRRASMGGGRIRVRCCGRCPRRREAGAASLFQSRNPQLV